MVVCKVPDSPGKLLMIPYRCNARLDHPPIATAWLIAANVALFLCVPDRLKFSGSFPLALSLGEFHPLQSFTCIFIHSNHVHLIGNMLFLWAFGMVVEGKIGWWRMLMVYGAIGTCKNLLLQIFMIGPTYPMLLGASGAIAGLMGIALVWAPRAEFDCIWIFRRFGVGPLPGSVRFTMTVGSYVYLWFVLQLLEIFYRAFMHQRLQFSSEMSHSLGALLGFAVGILWVRQQWVDNDGQDLISLIYGKPHPASIAPPVISTTDAVTESSKATAGRARSRLFTHPIPLAPDSPANIGDINDLFPTPTDRVAELTHAIQRRKFDRAEMYLQKLRLDDPEFMLPEETLLRWINELLRAKKHRVAAPKLMEYIHRFESQRSPLQFLLAKILVKYKQEQQAVAVLEAIDWRLLSEEQAKSGKQLLAQLRRP
jgi:membrane associated rhomboid family serine protease